VMHWPRIRGLAASAGVWLRANETEISAAPWALRLGKGLFISVLITVTHCYLALNCHSAPITFANSWLK